MKAVIALGSNIGSPKENLDLAIELLKQATEVHSVSSYYTTAPVGGPAQPDYLNAVCIIESDLPALDLLSLLHGIEKALGRERIEKWGPRTIDLDLAIELLKQATEVNCVSSYYTTAPVGGPAQPDYLNAVCIIESDLPALDLLSLLHGIEKALGRERIEKWGPRTIDLDLIQYGALLSKSDELELPHPRAHERRFVLQPWNEIEPDAILLTHGRVDHLLEHLPK